MNPAPGMSWPDLHYVDAEQVELDVDVIIARGTRLRRRRLVTKVAAAAVVVGIAPVAVVMDISTSLPTVHNATIAGQAEPAMGTRSGPSKEYAGTVYGPEEPAAHMRAPGAPGTAMNGPAKFAAQHHYSALAGDDLMFSLVRARVRRATTLRRSYGPLLAIAGARASSGIWFAATAAQLTLFRLSTGGALRSWPLPATAGSVRASAGVGLAVTSAGLAWVGVGSALLSLNTKNSQVSSWQVPGNGSSEAVDHAARHGHKPTWPGYSAADSVAVSPDGDVAVATAQSNIVQVLDPRAGTFRPIRLPDAADQPLAVGYARDGTLGIGYLHPGGPDTGAVLLVSPAGKERSTSVAQPTSVTAYGASGLLVGVTRLAVVPVNGRPRPLLLPADSPDLASVISPPAPLPGDRLGIAMDTAILTFPATATSTTIATSQSELWITESPQCRPHHSCPAGYQLVATDVAGDMWVVPRAERRTVELVSLG